MQGVACVLMKRWSFGTTACFLAPSSPSNDESRRGNIRYINF